MVTTAARAEGEGKGDAEDEGKGEGDGGTMGGMRPRAFRKPKGTLAVAYRRRSAS
ncbi:hypothetical protein ALMP_83240 [Streptomyces sp. A012304]|nr:hypothetical protein ALMP_83240 [Streptomyces sp. A012304]